MKNSIKKFVALLLLLVGLVGYLGGAREIVMAEENTWIKEDFLYSNDTTIIALSDQGIEKSKTNKTLKFPEGVETINGNYSLSHRYDPKRFEREFGRGKEWDKIIIPDSVKYLGYALFYDARVKEVDLSNNLKIIGGLAFFNNGLEEVTLPNSLEVINHNAFERNKLETIIIPETVKNIEQYAFTRNKIHTIKILGEPKISEKGAFTEQVASYKPVQNPFYEKHFGYNGNFRVDNLPEELSYENGEFSFKNDDVDRLTFDFNLANNSYTGSMTIVNPHKYGQGVQVEPETTEAGTQTESPETSDQVSQTRVEVLVKYVFSDGKLYKEDKLSADIGAVLDSGDLPMLADDMKFIDDFLFYEVKEKDNLIERKVEKLTEDKEVQTDKKETKDVSSQTELVKDDIEKLEKKSDKLVKELEKLKEELKEKTEISKKEKEKLADLEKDKASLEEELEKAKGLLEKADKKEESKDSKACLEQVRALEEKLADIEKTLKETNQLIKDNKAKSTSEEKVQKKDLSQKTQSGIGDFSTNQVKTKEVTKTDNSNTEKPKSTLKSQNNLEENKEKGTSSTSSIEQKEKEVQVRYPNKLTPKQVTNSTSSSNGLNSSQPVNTNKGVASESSKARASVLENVDNANKDFPIHHGNMEDGQEEGVNLPYYSADARQFVTFATKNGKTFYLIINHDEESENVMLLTEVSEDDLLNMVETKEEPEKEEPVKKEEVGDIKEEPEKEKKKEEQGGIGTYLILGLVVLAVVGAGYYFKVVKAKEEKILEDFEEEEDFFDEAYEDDSDTETEEIDEDEELL